MNDCKLTDVDLDIERRLADHAFAIEWAKMQQERIDVLEAEIARCHARLEIDHVFRLKDGKLVRIEVPMAERLLIPDAVSCRDATIDEYDRQRKARPIEGTG